MNADQRPYIGVAVIVIRDDRVLLGKRRNAHGAGTWQFPGGHLEFGETIEGCAQRELFEETGLTITSQRMGPFTNDYFEDEGKHYVTLFVIADRTSGEVQLREPDKCARWDWFPWREMPKPHFLPIVNLLKHNFTIDDTPSPAFDIKNEMAAMANQNQAKILQRFFKTGPGEYAEGDIFLGIKVPLLRKLAKKYTAAGMAAIDDLLRSAIHEQRQLALLLLIQRFETADADDRKAIVAFYLDHTDWINNWDLVDCSAHAILGTHLINREKKVLFDLARSASLWERRIAIVATWHFIRGGQVNDTMKLAALLLDDTEDLIHKALGWMLREAGERDTAALEAFIASYYNQIPRTTLRTATERWPTPRRQLLLKGIFPSETKRSKHQ